jgi:glyoxylase-like metal-dependent hydrolase (beta-lactamase superfamily II)
VDLHDRGGATDDGIDANRGAIMRHVLMPVIVTLCVGSLSADADEAAPPGILQVAADASGIFANSYLVETGDGIVVVDGQLLSSGGRAVRARVEATGKPLLAVLVTHGHPDHYNGITDIVAGTRVPVISTAGVDRVIRQYDAAKERQWASTFGPEWPAKRTFPNRILGSARSVTLGGVTFTVHDLGPGESHSDSYWTAEVGGRRVAFIGDTVLQGVHAYVTDGHTTQWLVNLDRLRRELAGTPMLYPGHGAPGGSELLDGQRAYLERYRAAVQELAGGANTLTEGQKKELTKRMRAVLPTDRLEFLIPLGADPVAAELAGSR